MSYSWDEAKRQKTLDERGLDFARAAEVFGGRHFTAPDLRRDDYGEERFISTGRLDGRMVLIVWTPRDGKRRIISMRKANEREQEKYSPLL